MEKKAEAWRERFVSRESAEAVFRFAAQAKRELEREDREAERAEYHLCWSR